MSEEVESDQVGLSERRKSWGVEHANSVHIVTILRSIVEYAYGIISIVTIQY